MVSGAKQAIKKSTQNTPVKKSNRVRKASVAKSQLRDSLSDSGVFNDRRQ